MTDAEKKCFKMRPLWGALVVLVGIIFLLNEIGLDIRLGDYWPLFLIIPGLFFLGIFYTKRNSPGIEGILIPGTILTLLGLFFIFQNKTDWQHNPRLSFVYTFIVALAFFAAHLMGDKKRGYLIPAWILIGVSAIIFFSTYTQNLILPIILIIVGLWLLFKPKKQKKSDPQ